MWLSARNDLELLREVRWFLNSCSWDIRAMKMPEFGKQVELERSRASFPHINLGSSVLYIECSHRSSFTKDVFLSLKEGSRRVKERKPFF